MPKTKKGRFSKLREEDVKDVFRLHRLGLSDSQIAELMGVSSSNINLIRTRQTWKKVEDDGTTFQL